MDKKVLVISGINLVDGGAYSIYCDFLDSLVKLGYSDKYKVIALVGRKELFEKFKDDMEILEFPKSKKSWFARIYYEYIYFNKFSKVNKVNIWISLHDITPRVSVDMQYVYCHNPSPFNDMKVKDIKYGFKYYLFSKAYKFLYAINIHKNDGVIVQQDWMRESFKRMYNLKNEVIVSRPNIPKQHEIIDLSKSISDIVFVYPSFPRYYKNFEFACLAAKKLEQLGHNEFKLYVTLDGTENKYSKDLVKRFKNCQNIILCGLLSRNELYELYSKSSCLMFVSKLETWGMPITEFKATKKSMILADLPYAHETAGSYDKVQFVKNDDVDSLCRDMVKVIKGEKVKSNIVKKDIKQPYFRNWNELFNYIL